MALAPANGEKNFTYSVSDVLLQQELHEYHGQEDAQDGEHEAHIAQTARLFPKEQGFGMAFNEMGQGFQHNGR